VHVFSAAYVTTILVTVLVTTTLTVAARRRPGRWLVAADLGLAGVLVAVTATWLTSTLSGHAFHAATSLPLPLCDLATLVAAAALVTRHRLLVELTYFWGLAGTLQALLTPDLSQAFPSLVFFEYVLSHAAVVCAAVLLVVGQQLGPRRQAVARVLAVTIGYSALVGLVDALTGGNYMYLRRPPGSWTLLKVLGPWPWYIVSALGVAVVLFTLLDLPFWRRRAREKEDRAKQIRWVSFLGRRRLRSRRVRPSRL
jgi:hypothetical integral membrane protein (TIGR02206 family)